MEIHKTIIRTTACILCFGALAIPAKAYLNPTIEEKPRTVTVLSESPFLTQIVKMQKVKRAEAKRVEIEIKETNEQIRLSDQELISVLKEAGFYGDGLTMAWAIVQKESTARPFAHNDNPSTGDNSYGLFQINMRGSMGPDRREKFNLESNDELFDAATNAKIAFIMSSGGKSWGAWTTHESAKLLSSSFPG
jgi:hypothetical protein